MRLGARAQASGKETCPMPQSGGIRNRLTGRVGKAVFSLLIAGLVRLHIADEVADYGSFEYYTSRKSEDRHRRL